MDTAIQPNTPPIGFFLGESPETVRLSSCDIDVSIGSRTAVVTQRQTFENVSKETREVTYALPAPDSSVILEMSITLGDRVVRLEPKPEQEARKIYDQAYDEGDTAVLMRDLGEGVQCLELGRLLPGETAVVETKYALPLSLSGQQGELRIPTTIAPRYGAHGTTDRHMAMGESSILAEHPLRLSVTMWGVMRGVEVTSPTHPLDVDQEDRQKRVLTLNRKASKDRDIVLKFDGIVRQGTGMHFEDPIGGGRVLLADVYDEGDTALSSRNVHILVDCSGSMEGDSVEIARTFLEEFAAKIGPYDTVSLSRFGSGHEFVFRGITGRDTGNRLLEASRKLDSNMGGTRLLAALELVSEAEKNGMDILLLTDGLVHEGDDIISQMRRNGRRLFAVGIGSAPRADLLRAVPEQTGGLAAFVSPAEDPKALAERFALALASPMRELKSVSWGDSTPEWHAPTRQAIHRGEPTSLFAKFADGQPVPHKITVSIGDDKPTSIGLTAIEGDAKTLSKLVAQHRHNLEPDRNRKLKIALQYGLVTSGVSFVGVVERTDKSLEDAASTVIKPMMAAGYGGFGSELVMGHKMHEFYRACNEAPPEGRSAPAGLRRFRGSAPGKLREASFTFDQPIGDSAGDFARIGLQAARRIDMPLRGIQTVGPVHFLVARSWETAQSAMSRTLRRECQELLGAGWETEEIWGSLFVAVLTALAVEESLVTQSRGLPSSPALVSYFSLLISDNIDPDRWVHDRQRLEQSPHIKDAALRGP